MLDPARSPKLEPDETAADLTMFLRYLDGRIAVRPPAAAATLDDRFG